MEEILASIRRIISDDESNATQQSSAPLPEAGRSEVEEEADTRIIDDIARVLSGGAPAESATEDDDILDLTKELSELQAVADETASLPELEFPAPAGMAASETIALAETEIVEPVASVASEITLDDVPAEETISELDKVIAALRAQELPPSQPEPAPIYKPAPESVREGAPEAIDEPELVLTEIESETERVSEIPPWRKDAEPAPQPEPRQVNGGSKHGHRTTNYSEFGIGTGNSLEDSVKEMLRPLLREWLNEHMSRVLEAALRDELKDAEARWQRNEQRRWP